MRSRKVPLRRDETLTEAGHPRHADDGPQRRPQPVLKSISKDKRCAETAERHKAGPTHSKPTRTRGRTDVVDDRSSVVAAGGAKASTPSSPSDAASFDAMKIENMRLLSQDRGDTWHNGVARLSTSRASAASMLAWVIEHTSRKTSVIVTNTLRVDGFQNWEHVHAGSPNDERQRAHTFVITRAQRRHALLHIPGLSGLVAEAKGAVESLRLHDMPAELEWLHGHILNQGDVNARFEYHQDTGEERSRIDERFQHHIGIEVDQIFNVLHRLTCPTALHAMFRRGSTRSRRHGLIIYMVILREAVHRARLVVCRIKIRRVAISIE